MTELARASLILPAPLPAAPRVAVLAISSSSKPDRIEQARERLRADGAETVLAENVYVAHRYLAGTDAVRLESINSALRSDEFDAYFFARGGYGAMRILDAIDYDAVARNPRPIIGYSDVTALHQAVARRAGVASFHGPMLNTDFYEGLSPQHHAWFWGMLRGEAPLTYRFSAEKVLAPGRAEGIIFGGCLSLTASLLATPYDFWIDDGIWFWEDVSEPTYRIDRMLTQLNLSGRLERIRGVIIGSLKECGERDGEELEALLNEFFANRGIPVVRDLPFGHAGNNLLMPIGVPAVLDTVDGALTFPDACVAKAAKK